MSDQRKAKHSNILEENTFTQTHYFYGSLLCFITSCYSNSVISLSFFSSFLQYTFAHLPKSASFHLSHHPCLLTADLQLAEILPLGF